MAESRMRRALVDARVLFAVTFGAALLVFLGRLIAYDLWWHLKAGRLILALRGVPQADPFSFTAAGRPWTYHSWLAGLVFTGVHAAAGVAGLIWLRSLLIALSLMIAWIAARRRGVDAGLAAALVLAACVQLKLRALARPYLFSFVLFAVFVAVLQACTAVSVSTVVGRLGGSRKRLPWLAVEDAYLWGSGGRLLLLPVLTVLWANLHAGFVVGLLLIGAFGVGEMVCLLVGREEQRFAALLLRDRRGARFRAMFVAGVLCLAASVITPQGPGTLLYPFRLLHSVKLVKRVQEWQPMPLSGQFAIFWALVALGLVIIARSLYFGLRARDLRGRLGQVVTDLLLVAGFVLLAAQTVRHMAWYLLLAPSVLGRHLEISRRSDAASPGSVERAGRLPFACGAYVLAFVIGVLPLVTHGLPRFEVAEGRLPGKACDFMQAERLDYRVYNSYEWGGYLIWRFWPRMRVFIDGRCLVYGDEIMGQALRVEEGEQGWENVLDSQGIEMLFVNYRKKDSAHLFASGRWRCIYWDDAAVIALRDDVLAARGPGLQESGLSNPAVMGEALEHASPVDILVELDQVLMRDAECWTALALRARCLVRLAQRRPEERAALLQSALAAAQRAVELRGGRHETWRALAEAAGALGDEDLASRAARKAGKLRPAAPSTD